MPTTRVNITIARRATQYTRPLVDVAMALTPLGFQNPGKRRTTRSMSQMPAKGATMPPTP